MDKPIVRLQRYAPHQRYFLKDGTQVAGCSSICRMGDDPQPLIAWANREGLKGNKSAQIRDQAADRGQVGHFLLDCHLRGVEPDLREFTPEEISDGENVFLKGLDFLASESLEVVAFEEQLVSEAHRYGGTLDLVAKDDQSRFTLLDWKSSKAVYNSHKWQLGGYELLWNENYPDKKIERRAIININRSEKGTFKVYWLTQEDAEKHMRIFQKQAALYNQIRNDS